MDQECLWSHRTPQDLACVATALSRETLHACTSVRIMARQVAGLWCSSRGDPAHHGTEQRWGGADHRRSVPSEGNLMGQDALSSEWSAHRRSSPGSRPPGIGVALRRPPAGSQGVFLGRTVPCPLAQGACSEGCRGLGQVGGISACCACPQPVCPLGRSSPRSGGPREEQAVLPQAWCAALSQPLRLQGVLGGAQGQIAARDGIGPRSPHERAPVIFCGAQWEQKVGAAPSASPTLIPRRSSLANGSPPVACPRDHVVSSPPHFSYGTCGIRWLQALGTPAPCWTLPVRRWGSGGLVPLPRMLHGPEAVAVRASQPERAGVEESALTRQGHQALLQHRQGACGGNAGGDERWMAVLCQGCVLAGMQWTVGSPARYRTSTL